MQLFPQLHVQLLIALLSALLFFFTRTDRYLVASAAITVMALTCFNLIGDGFVLIVPRMVDTLLGCAIAAVAAFLILPDWQGRQLHLVPHACWTLRLATGFGAGPVPQRHAR